mgnify:CR=1 FL=1
MPGFFCAAARENGRTGEPLMKNVDPKELSRFAALAPAWWDRHGAFKALHDINGLRVGYINRRAPLAGRKVLDLGCGGGILSEAMASLGAEVTGVDAAPAMLALSRRLNPECEHVEGDMRSLRLGRLFDCVLVHDAVSYMASRADLASAIATAFEHTAPGGVAMFQPDFVSETFEPGTETGGSEAGDRHHRELHDCQSQRFGARGKSAGTVRA